MRSIVVAPIFLLLAACSAGGTSIVPGARSAGQDLRVVPDMAAQATGRTRYLQGDTVYEMVAAPNGDGVYTIDRTSSSAEEVSHVAAGGAISHFPLPAQDENPYISFGFGSDGAMWIVGRDTKTAPNGATSYSSFIDRMTTGGLLSRIHTFDTDIALNWIVNGPSGRLWFDELASSGEFNISCMTVSGSLCTIASGIQHYGVEPPVVGTNACAWGVGFSGEPYALTCVAANGDRHTVTVPAEYDQYTPQGGATIGPDGTLWFTTYSPYVARMTPGYYFAFYSSGAGNTVQPPIAVGGDRNIYFTYVTSDGADFLARMTPQGSVTLRQPVSTFIAAIAATPGYIWYTSDGVTRIAAQ